MDTGIGVAVLAGSGAGGVVKRMAPSKRARVAGEQELLGAPDGARAVKLLRRRRA